MRGMRCLRWRGGRSLSSFGSCGHVLTAEGGEQARSQCSAARIVGRRRVRRLPFPSVNEGAERRQALGAERRTRGPPRGRADLRFAGDQPANDAGRRASRRSTAALFGPGRAFQGAFAPPDQPTLGGGTVVSPRRSPGSPECRVTSPARGSRPRSISRTSPEDAPQRAKVTGYVLIFLNASTKS